LRLPSEQDPHHMAKKPNPKPEMVTFDVVYDDGTQLSNRRVPGNLLSQLDADDQIRAFIEAQDRDIGERSGRPRGSIKTIARSK